MKSFLVSLAIVCGFMLMTQSCGGSSGYSQDNSFVEEGYYIADVEGNTLITNIGTRIKLLGIKADSKQAEQYIRKNIVGNYVDLIRDSKTGKSIQNVDDEVYRYVLFPSAKENSSEKQVCVNSQLIDTYRMDVYDNSFVVDSLEAYNALVQKRHQDKIPDLALYMKQRTFLIETPEGIGTGFFINDKGLAVTNNHVIANVNGKVWLYADNPDDSNVYSTKTRGIKKVDFTNPVLDITIFTVDLDADERVPYFNLADRHAKQGAFVATIGNPHGLTATYSAPGNVSAYRQDPYYNRDLTVMQYTIPTNPGNSGGPIAGEDGLIYAVHEMGDQSMQNTNYGIDILEVRSVLDNLNMKYGGK